jgi:hypothetical protein
MRDDFGNKVRPVKTVPATTKFLTLLLDNFSVLENFHPAFEDSVTIVDVETGSAITVVIVEAADKDDVKGEVRE